MADDEGLLLQEPDLMLALLRAASNAPAGVDDAIDRLYANLVVAGEPPPAEPGELRGRLDEAIALLMGAGALRLVENDRFHITERGTALLAKYPDGVDQSVLHQFAEFRAHVTAHSHHETPDDVRLPAFEAGMQAYGRGAGNDANPHAFDSADHLAWECGWSEARDAAKNS
ncbi:MAG: hypothetical protein WAS21_22785 [Geminicoccaceae bacterium]